MGAILVRHTYIFILHFFPFFSPLCIIILRPPFFQFTATSVLNFLLINIIPTPSIGIFYLPWNVKCQHFLLIVLKRWSQFTFPVQFNLLVNMHIRYLLYFLTIKFQHFKKSLWPFFYGCWTLKSIDFSKNLLTFVLWNFQWRKHRIIFFLLLNFRAHSQFSPPTQSDNE